MKTIRRLIFSFSLLAIAICVLLLMNVTAPNPTGRRYSSRSPLTTGQGNAGQIGLDAEQILSADLHLPRNDAPDQRQCVCNAAGQVDPNACRICLVKSANIDTYRRPDFVGERFIVESKNARDVLYDSRDADQIADFVSAAKELGAPLWIFTRVNTNFPPDLERFVESTGGGVVPYFSVPDYVDPTDALARDWLGRMGIVAVVMLGLEGMAILTSRSRPAAPPPSNKVPVHPVTQAKNAVDRAEQALDDHLERARRRLD
ncbi:MAG: hypothetical protein KF716_32105 [Anaerolineae bacterium]|nr:hypothetical protein [Anaerolineae bacterium]